MAEVGPTKPETSSSSRDSKLSRFARLSNPILRLMGLPNARLRLPSRNWMIFLSIMGSFSAAVIYDHRETRRAQRKWCKLVEHLALEPLDPRSMPRRLTVFLEAPPADGLRVAQDHFREYVKPILVASGLDWQFIQGRKEGDVQIALAKKIRKLRKPADEFLDEEDMIARVRRQNGVKEFDGAQGDIVIGRHTWKEYLRGLHEGWLGPLDAPTTSEAENQSRDSQSNQSLNQETTPEAFPGESVPESGDKTGNPSEVSPEVPSGTPKELSLTSFISPSAYSSAPTPAQLPSEFGPSMPITFPHILGFLNTPTRLYRFLNRRYLADTIGRETAAIILSTYRPYRTVSEPSSPPSTVSDDYSGALGEVQREAEQVTALLEEEKDWHKSVHKHTEGESERAWLDDIILDPRIAGRMRRAELTKEDEEKAARIVITEEEIEGLIKGSIRKYWRAGREYFGLRSEGSNARSKFSDGEQGS